MHRGNWGKRTGNDWGLASLDNYTPWKFSSTSIMPAATKKERWKTEGEMEWEIREAGKIIEFESWKGLYRTTEGK